MVSLALLSVTLYKVQICNRSFCDCRSSGGLTGSRKLLLSRIAVQAGPRDRTWAINQRYSPSRCLCSSRSRVVTYKVIYMGRSLILLVGTRGLRDAWPHA